MRPSNLQVIPVALLHGMNFTTIIHPKAQTTFAVSPDNRSRMEMNNRIHAELQGRGLVRGEEHPIPTLVPRQDLTRARTWAARYEVGDVLRYAHRRKPALEKASTDS